MLIVVKKFTKCFIRLREKLRNSRTVEGKSKFSPISCKKKPQYMSIGRRKITWILKMQNSSKDGQKKSHNHSINCGKCPKSSPNGRKKKLRNFQSIERNCRKSRQSVAKERSEIRQWIGIKRENRPPVSKKSTIFSNLSIEKPRKFPIGRSKISRIKDFEIRQ